MFRRGSLILIPAALGLALAIAGRADAGLVTLYNTGVNAGGSPLPGGSTDPHWSVVDGPGVASPTPAVVVNNQLAGTYAQSSDSSWIWINADGSGATGQPYTFRMTFDLTGYDPSTVSLSGSWGVDNNGSIDLNGAAAVGTGELVLGGGSTINFNVFHDFRITGGFVAGINTLDFLAEDDGNPGALNVTNLRLTTQAVPEPASLVLLATGVGGIACRARRRGARPATA